MPEKVFQLPQDIFPDRKIQPREIIVNEYVATPDFSRGKSMLTMNAISLVVAGRKTMHFAEKKVTVSNSTFHLLSAGNCVASTDFLDHKEFRSVLMFFDNEAVSSFHLKYHSQINAKRENLKLKPEPYVSIDKDAYVWNFIESLRITPSAMLTSDFRRVKFEEFMLYLLQKHPSQLLSFLQAGSIDDADLQFRRAIEANVTSRISLTDLAFLCNMSVSTFKRRFKAMYGMPPNRWFTTQRMKIAATMLIHAEKPSEVFHKVGYDNHSSFTQSFKQLYGVTPTEYQSGKV